MAQQNTKAAPSAQEMRADITRLKNKVAHIEGLRAARVEAVKVEREAQIAADKATLEKLAKLRLAPDGGDIAPGDVFLSKVPGSTNGGPALLRGLAEAREALPIVVDALEYRIAHGPHPLEQDPEIARLDDLLGRTRLELADVEGKFAAARAAAQAWLAEGGEADAA